MRLILVVYLAVVGAMFACLVQLPPRAPLQVDPELLLPLLLL